MFLVDIISSCTLAEMPDWALAVIRSVVLVEQVNRVSRAYDGVALPRNAIYKMMSYELIRRYLIQCGCPEVRRELGLK